jgi:hypothetical protein
MRAFVTTIMELYLILQVRTTNCGPDGCDYREQTPSPVQWINRLDAGDS